MPVKSHRDPAGGNAPGAGARIIRKYGNRRLYDTGASSYVTLEDLVEVFAGEEEVRVVDAVSGEDLTKRVLAHAILFEEQRRQRQIIPLELLRQMLRSSMDPAGAIYQRKLSRALAELSPPPKSRPRTPALPERAPRPVRADARPSDEEMTELRRRLQALEKQVQRR
jgi:polyhydroxyalkanoate synthesis repressor PhaR